MGRYDAADSGRLEVARERERSMDRRIARPQGRLAEAETIYFNAGIEAAAEIYDREAKKYDALPSTVLFAKAMAEGCRAQAEAIRNLKKGGE